MDFQELFVILKQNVREDIFDSLNESLEYKLKIMDFLIDKKADYQRSNLYKEATQNFVMGGHNLYHATEQFKQLADIFSYEKWKIYYEFGTICTNTYNISPNPIHKELAIDFTTKSIIYLLANDSPIKLTLEEKNMAIIRMLFITHGHSIPIANSVSEKLSILSIQLHEKSSQNY